MSYSFQNILINEIMLNYILPTLSRKQTLPFLFTCKKRILVYVILNIVHSPIVKYKS